jgi:hypothetical protein
MEAFPLATLRLLMTWLELIVNLQQTRPDGYLIGL